MSAGTISFTASAVDMYRSCMSIMSPSFTFFVTRLTIFLLFFVFQSSVSRLHNMTGCPVLLRTLLSVSPYGVLTREKIAFVYFLCNFFDFENSFFILAEKTAADKNEYYLLIISAVIFFIFLSYIRISAITLKGKDEKVWT